MLLDLVQFRVVLNIIFLRYNILIKHISDIAFCILKSLSNFLVDVKTNEQ